jgi:hypothetical protein
MWFHIRNSSCHKCNERESDLQVVICPDLPGPGLLHAENLWFHVDERLNLPLVSLLFASCVLYNSELPDIGACVFGVNDFAAIFITQCFISGTCRFIKLVIASDRLDLIPCAIAFTADGCRFMSFASTVQHRNGPRRSADKSVSDPL